MNNLEDCFVFYLQHDETMPVDFWTNVADLWNKWEGGNLTRNAVRKRFKRRAISVRGDIDFAHELAEELYVEDAESFKERIITSKQDFTAKAQKNGVKTEYEDFLKKHDIDPDDVTNVYFKEKADGVRFTVQTRFNADEIDFDPLEVFQDSLSEYKIPSLTIDKPKDTAEKAVVINLLDAHLDKVCSLDDSDDEATIETNVNDFEMAFNDLLLSIKTTRPEHIYIPVGNDFFHTNDFRLTTKSGTNMSDRVHISGMEAFRIGLDMLRRCIDKARQIANVTLIPVPGNHDHSRIDYLLECLLLIYENQEDVLVMDNHKDRKYVRYGEWLLGFSHGDKRYKAKDIPQLMATDKDSREHWSDIKKAVFFLGHIHHEKRYDYMTANDFRGCKVMFLRSVGANDEWHWSNGYSAIPKTAYAFVYSKNGKREQEFKVNI